MVKKNKLKKGATLIELTVVLAVLAIITTMVVSFSVFLGERSKTSVKVNSLMQDVVSIKTTFESWVNELTKEDATFTCQDGSLTANKDGVDYSIILDDNTLTATLPSGNISIKIEQVFAISFNYKENPNQTLYVCKAFYFADNSAQYFSFTCNPFVGDLV